MSIDRGILEQQLDALGEGARWWNHRELRDLPTVLIPGEQIRAIARGKVGRVRFMRRSWLIVVTDRRLLCLRSSWTSWRQLELLKGRIHRVKMRLGPFRGRLILLTQHHAYRLLVSKNDAYKLSAALEDLVQPMPELTTSFRPTRVAGRVIDHILALPAAAFQPDAVRVALPPAPPAQKPENPERVEELEQQVDQLKEQVEFLQELLKQRQEAALLGKTD